MAGTARDPGTRTPSWSQVLRSQRSVLTGAVRAWGPAAVAALGLALVMAPGGTWTRIAGYVCAALAAGVVAWVKRSSLRKPSRGGLIATHVSTRVLLLITVAGALQRSRPQDPWTWPAVVAVLLVVIAEPTLKAMIGRQREVVVNLPGVAEVPIRPFAGAWVTTTTWAFLAVAAVVAAAGAPALVLAVPALVPAALALVVARWALLANVASDRVRRQIQPALEALRPELVVYYAAVSGVRYQMGMWLPYLERLGRPFFVITREASTVREIASMTDAPVLVPRDLAAGGLDQMVVPTLRAAFYVQGSPANQTFQRYRQLTHIWLNHGDSDKQANFHPRHATYDKLFLSGEQAIERYHDHGIDIPRDKIVLVGRPQVETIEARDAEDAAPEVVLYAPTWKGGRPSTSYSSLPIGPQIVAALLTRGKTVVFRPHPLSDGIPSDRAKSDKIRSMLADDAARSGRAHVWGEQAERTWDVPGCFNATDALITDVSSLASDYLATDKPLAMVAMLQRGEDFRRETPLARVAYLIEKDLSTLDSALDDLLGPDPLRAARAAYRSHCLGEVVGERAADEFLRQARAILDAPPASSSPDERR